ncbi:50S ribosomal protein L21 [Neoehrlichia mikurensis]|uniref:Large ribosomal subunit protein bL21 n=1 Tax=Neoehrlichia mikurensis TaxID=89586 RepID=A0A9Q9F3W4_9RICK|nr:50S ribosomal protein L21 [Neoehrlichia mikurensis]QXK91973.1 50S ribosomal protein L21 [Neoehrlichia mikurensis]QXK92430.1 50S ribosomal protein L21 [Neoehrlichia mikurensis]QXK93665.1 50S ribosomal protein L21 [Neoehrlichia mikurensis]UTO55368.1 50S ribosomal protein L21 [Neoehrlichia mikurensis]UTO56288.1 50S ribosomal protein L21 [Neoehrlichia mikurensis]
MFAIIETGGKQYKVKEQDVIKVEKIKHDVGETITLNNVVAFSSRLNHLSCMGKISVIAEVIEQCRDKKIIVFKKKRRKNYRRKNGHRQYMTVLRITKINDNME